MLKFRSLKKEIIDNLSFQDPLLIHNIQDMAFLNKMLGYNRSMIRAIKKVIKRHPNIETIADFGCASGDSLRVIARWMRKKHHDVKLIGIDANECTLKFAQEASILYPKITFQKANFLENTHCKNSYDIIILNNLCHHFEDIDLIMLLKRSSAQAKIAVIIHDLHRHIVAFLGIKLLSIFCLLSPITKNDGPLSVLKSFKKNEWIRLLQRADIKTFQIKWTWAFRWQIIIWCQ